MSSSYRILCMSHDPAIEAAEPHGVDEAVDMAIARFEGHPDCDLVVARYSGGLVELGCPAMGNPDGTPARNRHSGWHRDTVWGDAALLRIAAAVIETEADGHAEVLTAALKRLPMCWSAERLHRLRHVLGVAL